MIFHSARPNLSKEKKKSRREKNIGTEGAGERRGRKGDV